jgi:hypothetical protein
MMTPEKIPYTYKGIEDILTPHIRPSGEGGCKWPTELED